MRVTFIGTLIRLRVHRDPSSKITAEEVCATLAPYREPGIGGMMTNFTLLTLSFFVMGGAFASAADTSDTVTFQTDTYARSTTDFRKETADHYWHKDGKTNVLGVIKEGSHAKVVKWEKTRDGQLAGLMELSDGDMKGKQAWVFYDPKSTFPGMKIERRAQAIPILASSSKSEKPKMEATAICTACQEHSQLEVVAKTAIAAAKKVQETPNVSVGGYRGGIHPRWETSKNKDAKKWSQFAYDTVEKYGKRLLKGSNDMNAFCPNYEKISREQKIGFWVYLFSEMSLYESSWDPNTHVFGETPKGGDPVTGGRVYADGLMQISYGERVYNKGLCDELDWSKDKHLAAKDPNKTILNPYNNLKCAIRIFDSQLPRENLIASRRHDPLNSVAKIQAATKSIPFCKR
jgi:hypothetical protein